MSQEILSNLQPVKQETYISVTTAPLPAQRETARLKYELRNLKHPQSIVRHLLQLLESWTFCKNLP